MRRLKQTWIAAALGMSVWMTACAGAASETATQEGAVDEESQGAIREAVAENDQAQEQPERDKTQETERTEPLTVEPVRETLNMTHFDNCTFAAGFKPQQIHQDESNVIITLTVYDYEHFHKADIDELQTGDTLLIDGKECLITSIDRQESGRIEINGGPAQGGEELRMVEEDSFYGSEMAVGRSYHKLGEVTLQMDENFVLTDDSDPDTPPQVYTAEELFAIRDRLIGEFKPYNTAGSCLLLICGCILFYGVFLPWAVKGIIQLCRQAAGYLSARA